MRPNTPKLRCQPITRRAPLAPTARTIRTIKRKARLQQLIVAIERSAKHRRPMTDTLNRRPDKYDYLIAAGRI